MRGPWKSICVALAAVSLTVGVPVANAADNASATLTMGKEQFPLKYAFAAMDEELVSVGGKEKLNVFLSDQPLPDELRKASRDWFYWAARQASAGSLHGVIVALDPATSAWEGGQLLTRRGFMFYSQSVSSPELSDLRFAPAGPIGDQVAGKVSMKAPMSAVQEEDGPWRVDGEFRATVIRRPAASAVLTGPAAENSPQYKAVLVFLDAARKKDLDAIRKSLDPQSLGTIDEMIKSNKDETLNMFAGMAAETAGLKLSKVTVRGDSAEIEFTAKAGSDSKQSLRVALVKGEWKLAQ